MGKKKKIEPICKNCLLFDPKNNICHVTILNQGERVYLPVEKDDKCFFETEFQAVNPDGEVEKFKAEVKQTRWWCEDKNGNKSDHGAVKIEYDKDFFGTPPSDT